MERVKGKIEFGTKTVGSLNQKLPTSIFMIYYTCLDAGSSSDRGACIAKLL